MRNQIIAEAYAAGQRYAAQRQAAPDKPIERRLLTTGPAAAFLGVHPNTVRNMVLRHQLACELTAAGARLFRMGELMRAALERLDALTRSRAAVLAQRRLWMVASAYEPRQLDLLAHCKETSPRPTPARDPAQLWLPGPRLVHRSGSERCLEGAPRRRARSGLKLDGPHKRYFVNRKAVG